MTKEHMTVSKRQPHRESGQGTSETPVAQEPMRAVLVRWTVGARVANPVQHVQRFSDSTMERDVSWYVLPSVSRARSRAFGSAHDQPTMIVAFPNCAGFLQR
jgi:hypothetical protein